MLNGALYIRVSTHMQDELSPDAQKRLLLDYAKKQNITIQEKYIFIEKGVSGRKVDKRPVFQNMIAIAKSDPTPFHVILVWKFSRFARNQEESILYKSLLKRQYNIKIISISEPVSDSPFGSLIERIIEWMDEYYSMRLSDEVKRGMTEKAFRGGYQCKAPIGYKICSKGAPLTIDPDNAKIIKIIFQKFVYEHLSCHDIAFYLNKMGFCTLEGNPFQKRSIEYILKNPVYCGKIRWDHALLKGVHPPIIPTDLYDKAQIQLNQIKNFPSSSPSSVPAHYLSGLIKCPQCGRSMVIKKIVSKKNKKTYFYLSCYGNSNGLCPNNKNIRLSILEQQVRLSLQCFFEKYNNLDSYTLYQINNTLDDRNLIEDQLQKLQKKKEKISCAYISGTDSLDEYRIKKQKLDFEEETLRKTKENLLSSFPSYPQIHTISDFLDSSQYTTLQKNKFMKSFLYKIIYDPCKDTITIYYYLS